MALTINLVSANAGGHNEELVGRSRLALRDITLDSSYPAGGYTVPPGVLGLGKITAVLPLGGDADLAGLRPEWDWQNSKLRLFAHGPKVVSYSPGGGDLLGSLNTDSENVDAAAGGTNGYFVSSAAAFSTLVAGALVIAASPDVPRNVLIQIENTTGGALNLYQGVSTYTVVGTYRGVAQTETITYTSTAGNKSVGISKFRMKYGVKPFDTITSITVDNLGAATLSVGAGLGSKLGLPEAIRATGDVTKLTKTAADLSPSGIVDATNMTVNFGTLADGNDAAIQFLADGEVDTGRSLSAMRIRLGFLGL